MPPTISLAPRDGQAFIAECLSGINRHRWLFVATACLVTVLCIGIVALLPVRYTATASVVVAPISPDPLHSMPMREEGLVRDDEVVTQAALMTSRDLAVAIVGKFDVAAAPGPLNTLASKLCSWLLLIDHLPAICETAPEVTLNEHVASFLTRLRATPVPRTRMIDLAYTDADPDVAAAALNALVEAYQKDQVARRAVDLSRTSNWISERAETLRRNWLQAEVVAGQFRTSSGLTPNVSREGTSQPLVSQQMVSAAASLSAGQSELSAALARQEALRSAVSAPDKRSMVAMRDEPGLVSLANQLSTLQTQLDDMRAHFNRGYPGFSQVEAQIASLERQMSAETLRALHAIEVDVQIKRAATERMQRTLMALRLEAVGVNAKQVQANTLDDEARTARTVFETFLARAKQLDDRASLLQSQIQFAAHAVSPDRPSFPDRHRMWLGGAVLGLATAAGAVWLREYLARGFSNISRIGGSLAVPFLCAIPTVRCRGAATALPHYVQLNPFSSASEAMRSLLTGLQVGRLPDKAPVRSVIVASATGQEGKTTTSIWLAATAARGGSKVLLIDGDHRRGLVKERLQGNKVMGFSNLVFGNAKLDDVLERHDGMEFDFIGSGGPVARPFGRNEIERLRKVVTGLETRYDLVIIDTPPLLALTDTLIYASVTSGTIFLCRWGRTGRTAVASCLDRLRAAEANILGIAVSMIDQKRLARFSDDLTPYDVRVMKRYYVN